MSQTSDHTAAERRTLELAPFWILSSLSGRYRNLTRLELELFAEVLDAAALAPGRVAT